MARYIVFFHPGQKTPDRLKYIDDASDAPDANDDAATLGVTVGSLWLDTTNHRTYVCEDDSTGAAVWTELTGGATWRDPTTLATNLTASGSVSIDRDTAVTHDLTLTGNTTLTPTDTNPPGAGYCIDLRSIVRQDGTGGRTLTIGGTVTWAGGSAPTMPTAANAVLTLGFLSVDDGTTWLGYAGGGTSIDAATTVESETTFGVSAAVGTDTEYARQDHTHGTPSNPVTVAAVKALGRWEPVQYDDGSSPWPFVYKDDEIVVAFVTD